MADLVLSASSLDAYDSCHYRWYLQYIESQQGEQSVAAAVGVAVHKAIEEHYKAQMLDEPLAPELLRDIYDTTYVFESAGIADPELPIDRAMKWGRRALTTYLEDVAPDIEPTLVEYGAMLSVNGILVSGHLDVADKARIVHDTKIKGAKPRDPGVYLRAFTIYALLYRDVMGEKESDIVLDVIIRLKRDRPYHVPYRNDGPVSQRDIGNLAASLERVAEGIEQSRFEPTGLETDACRFCPVKTICVYYQALEASRAS